MISNDAYDGVELLGFLAVLDAHEPCRIQTLAEWISASVDHTEMLLTHLSRAGLLIEPGGSDTGYCLTRPAEQISVAEVVEVFDEPSRSVDRTSETEVLQSDPSDDPVGTDLLWNSLKTRMLSYLSNITLADVISETEFRFVTDENDGRAVLRIAPSVTIH